MHKETRIDCASLDRHVNSHELQTFSDISATVNAAADRHREEMSLADRARIQENVTADTIRTQIHDGRTETTGELPAAEWPTGKFSLRQSCRCCKAAR